MYRQRIQKAWGHTGHRGWARLLLDRAQDLIIHGPAHRGANSATIPTDEDDQDGHFFLTTRTRTNTVPYGTEATAPREGGLLHCLARQPLFLLFKSDPPH